MKVASILWVSGQLIAIALLALRAWVYGGSGEDWDPLLALALGIYVIALGALGVIVVILLHRLFRRLARAVMEEPPSPSSLDEVESAWSASSWNAVIIDVVGGLGLFVVGYAGVVSADSTRFNAILLGALLGVGFVRLHHLVRRRVR